MSEIDFVSEIEKKLEQISIEHLDVKFLDLSLVELNPIAIVKENIFYVFDIDIDTGSRYSFVKTGSIPGIQVPEGVLAAFPLPFYDEKCCVVVSESALATTEGIVFVFHEFVHCYQMKICELKLKEKLTIHKIAMESGNGMWEINHPYPFTEPSVADWLQALYESIKSQDLAKVKKSLNELKKTLKHIDYEYMVWQMWKEGYARYVENKLREFYKLILNTGEIKEINDRVIFYELGSGLIELINRTKTEESIADLYEKIVELGNVK